MEKTKRGTSTTNKIREILKRPYSRLLIPQDGGGFFAEILEFPGCLTEGETAAEVYQNLERVAESWVRIQLEKGEHIPSPLSEHEGSGKFALRLPRSLYAKAATAAKLDNVSMNQFISDAVAEKLGFAHAARAIEQALSEALHPRSTTFRLEVSVATTREGGSPFSQLRPNYDPTQGNVSTPPISDFTLSTHGSH